MLLQKRASQLVFYNQHMRPLDDPEYKPKIQNNTTHERQRPCLQAARQIRLSVLCSGGAQSYELRAMEMNGFTDTHTEAGAPPCRPSTHYIQDPAVPNPNSHFVDMRKIHALVAAVPVKRALLLTSQKGLNRNYLTTTSNSQLPQ
jgi:hypothetical protein